MSRSIRKTPIVKENSRGSNKKRKKIANSSIRSKAKAGVEIGNGNEYKKHYETWNISDYKFSKTEKEALEDYRRARDPNDFRYNPYLFKIYPTEKSFMRWWRTHYKNK